MSEIQQNRWDQLIRRAANIVGGGSQVNDTLNELFPTLDVETLNAELVLLSTWHLAHGATDIPGLAATINHSQLFNPVGSGNIIVPTRISIKTSANQEIRYALQSSALTDFTANNELFDSRLGVATAPVGQTRSVQQAGGLALFGEVFVQANVSYVFDIPLGMCVIAPGTGLNFANTSNNVAMIIDYQWRERVAQPAEVNF